MSETKILTKNQPQIATKLTKVSDTYMPLIMSQMENNDIRMSSYARQCVLHAISAINAVLDKAGLSWNDPKLDRSTVSDILVKIACFQLNAAASPREVYFQTRDYNTRQKDGYGKDIWKTQIEMGLEGDGNDALLARFGRGVADVGQIWKVREGDEFQYPTYDGMNMSSPKWVPKGSGKIVRIVYPILKNRSDGERYIEFYISEREDVVKNLIAHINNNLMKETFGIAKSKYAAMADQKIEIDKKKREILKRANDLGLDTALDDEELQPWINPAWTEYHSREAMIERKMRNNAIKKIPKDFGNGAMETLFEETTNDVYRLAQEEVRENQATLPMDIEPPEEDTKQGASVDAIPVKAPTPETAPEPEAKEQFSELGKEPSVDAEGQFDMPVEDILDDPGF